MTLQPLPSEFPYIQGKLSLFFFSVQCTAIHAVLCSVNVLTLVAISDSLTKAQQYKILTNSTTFENCEKPILAV